MLVELARDFRPLGTSRPPGNRSFCCEGWKARSASLMDAPFLNKFHRQVLSLPRLVKICGEDGRSLLEGKD